MKRRILLIALIAACVSFTSCEKNDDSTSSKIEITVKSTTGSTQSNTTVYLFTAPSTTAFGKNPMFALRQAITNSEGVATFEFEDDIALIPTISQTNIYFTVLKTITPTSFSVKGSVRLKIENEMQEENLSTSIRVYV